MDENNQILDVTYGHFSCRLEGFEDSVETMKLVVSFFHDLGGHDRFLDVGPLAPNMETLARLTEEQIGQAVDIDMTDNKVSLRVRSETPEENVAPEDTPEEAETAAEPDATEEPAPPAEADEEKAIVDDLSSVADKLQRMRAAAARKSAAASESYSEDLSGQTATPAANPLSQRLSDLVKRTTQAEDEAAVSAPADTTPEEPESVDASDVEEAFADDETLDAEDINVFSDQMADTVTSADDEAYEETYEDDFVAEQTTDATEIDDEDLVADSSADAATGQTGDAELDAFLAEEAEEELGGSDEEITNEDMADDADTPEMDAPEEAPLVLTTNDEAEEDLGMADEDMADDADAPEMDAPEEEPLVLTTDDEAEEDHDDYNDDDEFDLEKEVAKVEAEIAARKGNDFARRGLPRHVEDAMSRIMSQTDQHLNQPENRRHRDAFAQLKAAVAATEAARQLGDKGTEKRDPDEAYKDDLGAHAAKSESKPSLPPLKLVKSQEVKRPAATLQQPVTSKPLDGTSERLRQIATTKEAEVEETTGDFAEFAASHGATDLADQLEAAGAFICFIEGENDFSRPQVMKLVQSASDDEISREDGLRSFGRLLRQARLVKLANGRFQVADNSQYRPDGDQAAQG